MFQENYLLQYPQSGSTEETPRTNAPAALQQASGYQAIPSESRDFAPGILRAPAQALIPDRSKGKLDLLVLRYMTYKLRLTLLMQAQNKAELQPQFYYADEHHQRMHRIALYKPSDLQQSTCPRFVGFVSKKRQPLSASVNNSIYEVDKKLVIDLLSAPGLLSYSSLELRSGNWYNLVLFSDLSAKNHIQSSETHKYAAYQLAPLYYEWIRLHSGIIPGGLTTGHLRLQRTKYYVFQEAALYTDTYDFSPDITLSLQGYTSEHTSYIKPLPL